MFSSWKTLRSISANMCSEMLMTLALRPHLIYPSVKATLEATYYADLNFEESHGKDNLANAYKHALWSALLARKTFWIFRNEDRSLAWAKKITDLHEDCFKNRPEAREMDEFNNAKGRDFFCQLRQTNLYLSSKEIASYVYERRSELRVLDQT